MKTTLNTLKFRCLALILAASSLSACAGSNGEKVGRSAVAVTGANAVSGGASANPCGLPGGTIGRIYDDGSAGSGLSFEDRVKALVSADYNPSLIGTVAGVNAASPTCVTLEGAFKFDSSGQLQTSESSMVIKVYDSEATQKSSDGSLIGPYPMPFTGAYSGSMDMNTRTFDVTFSDQYGQVLVHGTVEGAQIRGSVSFANLKHFSGGTPASGTLGAFAISASSLLK